MSRKEARTPPPASTSWQTCMRQVMLDLVWRMVTLHHFAKKCTVGTEDFNYQSMPVIPSLQSVVGRAWNRARATAYRVTRHLLPLMTGQPECRLRLSRLLSAVWLKNRSASPAAGFTATPCWPHVEYTGLSTCCTSKGKFIARYRDMLHDKRRSG